MSLRIRPHTDPARTRNVASAALLSPPDGAFTIQTSRVPAGNVAVSAKAPRYGVATRAPSAPSMQRSTLASSEYGIGSARRRRLATSLPLLVKGDHVRT